MKMTVGNLGLKGDELVQCRAELVDAIAEIVFACRCWGSSLNWMFYLLDVFAEVEEIMERHCLLL